MDPFLSVKNQKQLVNIKKRELFGDFYTLPGHSDVPTASTSD